MNKPWGTPLPKEISDRIINNKDKYCNIEKRYLAESLSWLGFHYYKFNYGNDTIYSFENSEKFKLALEGLLQLRKSINNI